MDKHHDFDYELDDYEKGILDDLEKQGYKRSPDYEAERIKLIVAAKATLEKTKNINIRISQGDLWNIKSKAEEQGIPYQTLISSLIRQYVNNKIYYNVLFEPRAPYNTKSSPKPKIRKSK